MKNILKKVILLVLITNMTNCSKEEVDHEITEVNPDTIIVYDAITEGGLDVAVEIPKGKTKEDFILIDNKGRNLEINTAGNSIVEENTIVTLVNKETSRPIYIAYFGKKNTSAKITKASKNEKVNENKTSSNTCETILEIGVKSTTKFILASILQPISVFQFGTSENDNFAEVYDTTLLCDVFTDAQTLEIENVVKTLTEEGKDLGEVVVSSILKNIVQPITGGLFSDCWEILVSSISDRKVEFEAHPYEDYQISLMTYNEDNRNLPSVLLEFSNAMPTGVIIKDATFIQSTGKWNIKLDLYNSLPIPFGIRLGKGDASTLPIPVNNETNYIIKSNGISTVQQIKNGAGCQGFINNIHDTYYTLSSEGVALRSSDFDKVEVEFEFDPTNNYIIFEGPNENIRVKTFFVLESLSHIIDAVINIPDSDVNTIKKTKEELFFDIIEHILADQQANSLLNSTNASFEEIIKAVGQVLKNYIKKSIEDGVDTLFNNLRGEKASSVTTIEIIEYLLEGINLINYGDAWTKINSYSNLAIDYQLYIPGNYISYPENNKTVSIGEDFYLYFHNEISLSNDNSLTVKIYNYDSNNLIEELTLNELRVSDDKKKILFTPKNLALSTKYYIKIPNQLIFNSNNNTAFRGIIEKDEWSFTTTNTADIILPIQQLPENNATNVTTNVSSLLSWTLASWNNTNNSEEISYDLHFGTDATPLKYQSIPSGNTTPISSINANYNTKYYWKVVAKSGTTILGETPTWNFTTEENKNIPTITTIAISDITSETAISGGNITDDGGATITESGVVWSSSTNPTTNDNNTNEGSNTGSFTSNITGLTENTKYYVRAYATNSEGTAYGNEIEFTTTSSQLVTIPNLLTPANGATNIPNNSPSQLSWSESKWTDPSKTEPISYDLYFGTDSNPPKHQFIPAGNTSPNSLSTEPNTTYYWKVVAIDNQGTELESSEIRSFTTKNNSSGTGGIYEGNITLISQKEVDDFGAHNYNEINGNLILGGWFVYDTSITNLNSLSSLKSVKGNLSIIIRNESLYNLSGLENLKTIDGGLYIRANRKLNNLNSLKGITHIGGELMLEDGEFTDLNGFNNLISLGSLNLYRSSLVSLNGLSPILDNLKKLTINSNTRLENIQGLKNIKEIDDLVIISNKSLLNIEGLNAITKVNKDLKIYLNEKLENVKGIENLEIIDGNFILQSGLFHSLEGLDKIKSIGGNLEISYNSFLTDFCSISSLIKNEGLKGQYKINNNSYNPTKQEIIEGKCNK